MSTVLNVKPASIFTHFAANFISREKRVKECFTIEHSNIHPATTQDVCISTPTFDLKHSKRAAKVCRDRSHLYMVLNILCVLFSGFCGATAGIMGGLIDYKIGLAFGGFAAFITILNVMFKWGPLSETYAGLAYDFNEIEQSPDAEIRHKALVKRASSAAL